MYPLLTEEEREMNDRIIGELIQTLRGGSMKTQFKKLHDAHGNPLHVDTMNGTTIGVDATGKSTFIALQGNIQGFAISESPEEAVKILEG